MNINWKYLSILLMTILVALIGYLWIKPQISKNGTISIDSIDRDDFDYRKKQNPKFADENQDYFFNHETNIVFDQELYDYDTIQEGQKINKRIEFTNIGTEPFFILNVKVSCGCTVPTYIKEPIKPGEKGFVDIEFDSKGKEGFSMNKLSLEGNVPEGHKATFFKLYVAKK